jgi:arabinofuranosyltransferase
LGKGWVAEDAFISFRVVHNFVEGHGLRWNIDERVQVFTNPLWTLLHIPLYALTRDVFYTTIALGTALSTLTAGLLCAPLWRTKPLSAIILLACLAGSLASTEYATSGLENSLAGLLLALLYLQFQKGEETTPNWGKIALLTALLGLTRLDAVLLILPMGTYYTLKSFRSLPVLKILGGFSPLLLWWGFCKLYYGFVMPNTKLAKLDGTGLSLHERAWQSRFYLLDLLQNHTFTFLCLLAATGIGIYLLLKKTPHPRALPLLSLGIPLYASYIVYIGGDHYSGRYWALPMLCAAITIAYTLQKSPHKKNLLAGSLLCLALSISPLTLTPKNVREGRIEHARALSKGAYLLKEFNPQAHRWSNQGLQYKKAAQESPQNTPFVVAETAAGMLPFYSGPQVIVIDGLGITDPLTARLPVYDRKRWHSGHYWRAIPTGYLEYRRGDPSKMDPHLRAYYERLRVITSKPLLDPERLKTLWEFQTGKYDSALKKYTEKYQQGKP